VSTVNKYVENVIHHVCRMLKLGYCEKFRRNVVPLTQSIL